jgi:hypothetical protein
MTSHATRRTFLLLTLGLRAAAQQHQPSGLSLPNAKDSLHFAVIGDSGTGGRPQFELARVMEQYYKMFRFEFVLMLGDNIYGRERESDYETKFEQPYKQLLDAGVKFYASLGNHDEPNQRFYKNFNMNGQRYYTFKPRDGVRFFALDSNYMDPEQVKWLEKELSSSGSEWKIAFFHHPLYASGKHGSQNSLRKIIEPLFVKNGVNVVFAGHEHFYERIKPQNGIQHFVSGAAAKLRDSDIRPTGLTEKGFDRDLSFMLIEIAGDRMNFQVISRQGTTVDSGVVVRRSKNATQTEGAAAAAAGSGQQP